ncbi:hypothetical protein [Phenylobacterium sp.]|jgi:hypothetical protein
MIRATAASSTERAGTARQQYHHQDDASTDTQDDKTDAIHGFTR